MSERSQAALDDTAVAALCTDIAILAARAILRFDCRKVTTELKADESPVTAADQASEATILPALAAAFPGVPVVSEESADAWRGKPVSGTHFLVDPLDGTREFLAESAEYTVNIALVRDGIPVAGVIAAPALGMLWRGAAGHAERLRISSDGKVGEPVAIRTRAWPAGERLAAVSRSHYEKASADFLEKFRPVATVACGSALKFCRLAEGAIDIYPRLAPTSEWDVAAGHALVAAAGGAMTAPDGSALAYGRCDSGFRVPGFVAWGDARAAKL